MAEGEPTGVPEQKKGEEKLAEWLVPDPEELRRVGNPTLKTELHLLGRHGDRTTATPDRLLKVHERIEEMIRRGEITIEETGLWLDRIENRHQELLEGGGLSEGEMRAEELAIQRRREIQERDFYERSQQTYDGFVSAEQNRARLNPEMFDVNLPYWYNTLSPEAKQMIRTRINITNLAKHTQDFGMTDLDQVMEVVGIRIEREALDYMWKEMPGFRIAMATIAHDIFRPDSDHFVISGVPRKGKTPATGGYAIIERFDDYRTGLIDALKKYLEEYGNGKLDTYLIARDKDKYETAAIAAVSAADNLLYAGGAYFSGDEQRAVLNTKIWTEQPRAFFLPGVKGKVKWAGDIQEETVKGETFRFSGEEDWGGPLGDYMRERISHDDSFRERFKDEEIRYIPRRLYFSLFEHTFFNKTYTPDITRKVFKRKQILERKKVGRKEVSLAETLISANKVDVGNGLVDYATDIDLTQLKPDDLYGKYADDRSHVVAVYKHLTSRDPKVRLTGSRFIFELNKIRDDDFLAHTEAKMGGGGGRLLWDEDLMTAGVIMAASPETGPILGTNEIVLNIDDSIYDNVVVKALDDRMFVGMPVGFRGKLLKRLNARDITKLATAFISDIGWDNPLSRRKRLRRIAARNYERVVREAESRIQRPKGP